MRAAGGISLRPFAYLRGKPITMKTILEALPQNLEQICTAVITLAAAIIGAFRKGKAAGKKEHQNNHYTH